MSSVTAAVPEAVPTALARCGLDPEVVAIEPRFGGVHELWRVTTGAGAFAVHRIDDDRGRAFWGRIHELETAAIANGVPAPRPFVDVETGHPLIEVAGAAVVVHEWIDAEPVDATSSTPSFQFELGAALAATHTCGLDPGIDSDSLTRPIPRSRWLELAAAGTAAGWAWGDDLLAAADRFVAAEAMLDEWDRAAGGDRVFSHRDLTTANVLDGDGHPVLIDWESAGPISRGDEIGRTALDQFLGSNADDPRLPAFLDGYRSRAELPPVGPHWCGLWIRGLLVFAEFCAQSCIDASAPTDQVAFQSKVVAATAEHLDRRLRDAERYVAAFEAAAAG